MFLLRSVEKKDLNDLLNLSKMMNFINLPPYEDMLSQKINSSIKTFQGPSKKLWDNHYLFVMEDTETKKVIGVSMIHAQHGTEFEPHFFLKVGREEKYSNTLNTGFIHGTLKLGLETNGPTEIGGLILDPAFRGHPDKVGKQLSFIRFLYMALNQDKFKEDIHAELLPPFDSDGNSPLWEAIGRRFLNMNYHEADLLSRTNKEFILSLFPSEIIYETLLPLEARGAIGKVGKETAPVKAMLETIGLKYTHEVDPFDGGPHYRAKLKDISLVKNLKEAKVDIKSFSTLNDSKFVLMTIPSPKSKFMAVGAWVKITQTDKGTILNLPESMIEDLKLNKGFTTHFIPL